MPEVTHLAFWIESDPGPGDIAALEAALAELAERSWTVEAPSLVDRREEGIRSVGCALAIHDARVQPPDPSVDRLEYENASAVAEAVSNVSKERGLPFAVELGGEGIGSIEHGEQSGSLREGLFAEWRKHLG